MTRSSTPKASFHTKNRQKLRKLLKKDKAYQGLAAVIANSEVQSSVDQTYPFQQDTNFFYLTGIEESGIVLVMDGDDEYLIVPERNEVRLAFDGAVDTEDLKQTSGIETVLVGSEGWDRFNASVRAVSAIGLIQPSTGYLDVLDMYASPHRQRLFDLVKAQNDDITLIELRPHLVALRTIKTSYEIKMLERAIKETYTLFAIIERKRTKVTYEHDLLAEISRHRIKKQLKDAYTPIIASGGNAVTLHYTKSNAPLDKSGMLLLDIGLRYEGYNADISRTISYAPTKRQQAIYDAVLAVQEYAISLLKPGVDFRSNEKTVVEYMGNKLIELGLITENTPENVRHYYPHSTSHFLGLDVHDIGDYELPLAAGMVITVEPGIYIPEEEIGIRIEDNILITKDGYRVLSDKLPRNLASLTIEA